MNVKQVPSGLYREYHLDIRDTDLNAAAFVHLFLLLYELFNIAFEIFEIMSA